MFQNFFNFSRTNIKNTDRTDMTKNFESASLYLYRILKLQILLSFDFIEKIVVTQWFQCAVHSNVPSK